MLEHLRSGFQWCSVALILTLLAGNVPADPRAPEKKDANAKFAEAITKGQRVFSTGHSFHAGFASKPTKTAPTYPLKKSSNGRYLVDQNNVPYLIAGDCPQSLMVNFSEDDADTYFANRKSHGFNAVWINLLCKPGTGGRKDGSTYDGILPFTTADDLATPNEKYFARCDRMIKLAGKQDLLVILDPCETIDHLKLMVQNGVTKCRNYGQFLGNRYKGFDNILWMSGNDYQDWKEAKNDAVVTALALGIKDKDTRHLHTIELNYQVSGSLDDANWAPIISLNASYTYYPTYAQVLKDYNRSNFLPVFLVEAVYEFEYESTPALLRRQEYWANLSGATGQVYGNGFIWPAKKGWKSKLGSPGAVQMAYVKALFEPRAWYELVPDQKHTTVIAGYGTFDATTTDGNIRIMTSDYVTAARTPDGSLVLAYMPTLRPLTVDMTKLRGPVTARWYDPSRGVYTWAQGNEGDLTMHLWHEPSDRAHPTTQGSPLPNKGKRTFTPPGNNADGDGDWVLVLETGAPRPAPDAKEDPPIRTTGINANRLTEDVNGKPSSWPPSTAAVTGSAHGKPNVHRGLAYSEPKNKFQMLDIFAPAEGKNHPVVIYVHGGGWHSGDKAEVHNKPKALTDRGVVLASINYRLWTPPWSKSFPGTVTLKHQAQDVAKAIRWVHDHARDYGGDPAAMIVMGHSAGAHLAALVCTDERYLKAEGLSLANIKGCVPIDGDSHDLPMHMKANEGKKVAATDRERFGAENLQKELSPVMHVAKGKNIPPFLILHIVDPDHPETQAQAERFAQVLRAAGVPVKTHGAAGKDHSTLNNDLGLPDDKPTQEMFEFLSQVSQRQ